MLSQQLPSHPRGAWLRAGAAGALARTLLFTAGCGGDDTAGAERPPTTASSSPVSAKVNDVISENAFTIAGTEDTTLEELVVHKEPVADLERGMLVKVSGVVHKAFDLPVAESTPRSRASNDGTHPRPSCGGRTTGGKPCPMMMTSAPVMLRSTDRQRHFHLHRNNGPAL